MSKVIIHTYMLLLKCVNSMELVEMLKPGYIITSKFPEFWETFREPPRLYFYFCR